MGRKVRSVLAWLLIANGFIALGFVMAHMRMSWLPEYGQGFWWAWGSAFCGAPENILFVILAILAFIYLQKSHISVGGKG